MGKIYGKVVDVSLNAFIPTTILYNFCMEGAITFNYGDDGIALELTLWPEIMCYDVRRLGKLWKPQCGRIDSWDSEEYKLEYKFSGEEADYPFLGEALAYAMGYLKVKSFSYEKGYEKAFA